MVSTLVDAMDNIENDSRQQDCDGRYNQDIYKPIASVFIIKDSPNNHYRNNQHQYC